MSSLNLTVGDVINQAREQALRENPRYSHLDILEGSLIQDENHDYFKNKVRVKLRCGCGRIVERATSDLHTFKGCEACLKGIRKATKGLKKAGGKNVRPVLISYLEGLLEDLPEDHELIGQVDLQTASESELMEAINLANEALDDLEEATHRGSEPSETVSETQS